MPSIVTTYAGAGSGYVVPSAAAKAGVLALTRSLAVEWGRYQIGQVAIAPGPFPTQGAWTRLMPRSDIEGRFIQANPLGRVGHLTELTNLAAYLISDGAGCINGEVVTIDGAMDLRCWRVQQVQRSHIRGMGRDRDIDQEEEGRVNRRSRVR